MFLGNFKALYFFNLIIVVTHCKEIDDEEQKIREFNIEHGLWTPDPVSLVGLPDISYSEKLNHLHNEVNGITLLKSEAEFITPNNTRVTIQVDNQATLRCQIRKVSPSETVMWVRRRDHHLISLGATIYTADDRFFLNHSPGRQEWTLHIKFAQVRDSGTYECQIASHPPIGIMTTLNVIQPVSLIRGMPDMYAQKGSNVTLFCQLRHFTVPPNYVFWYKNDHMINYNVVNRISIISLGGQSTLSISRVSQVDSGKYTCAPSSAKPSSTNLHILPGDDPAAIMRSGCIRSSSTFSSQLLTYSFVYTSAYLYII